MPKTLLAGFVVAFSMEAFAATGPWTTGGPDGGEISCLAIDPVTPSTLYAGTTGNIFETGGSGVFKSTDSGDTWTRASTGLTNLSVNALALDPATPSVLYAGTAGGAFRSTDSGGTWAVMPLGAPPQHYVGSFAIDPTNPAILYATPGIFKSTDSGDTWATLPGSSGGGSLAIDPNTPTTLYVGTYGGIFKSTDSGSTWFSPAPQLSSERFVSLVIDPVTSSNIYATTGHGVIKSTDSGATWTMLFPGSLDVETIRVFIDPVVPSTLYIGVQGHDPYDEMNIGWIGKSTDSGATWASANTGRPDTRVNALAIDPTNHSTLYAATAGGIHRSLDGAAHWAPAFRGIANVAIRSVAIDPIDPSTLYAGTWGFGVYKSTDSGGTWFESWRWRTTVWISAVAVDPVAPSTVYATTMGSDTWCFKSTDAGATWFMVGYTPHRVSMIAIDPVTPSTVYVAAQFLLKSVNGGGGWVALRTDHSVVAVAINPSTPSTLYAGWVKTDVPDSTEGGALKSTDAGVTWAELGGLTGPKVNALAIDPTTPSTLYAGTSQGVYKSTDAGGTWAAANSGLANLRAHALIVNPALPSTIYAGTDDGVFQSVDSGGSWHPVGTGGPSDRHVQALALDPAGATTIFAGFRSESVWQSTGLFDLTTWVSGGGTISNDPAGTSCGTNCQSHPGGTVVTLTPHPSPGFVFSAWGGACSGAGACSVTMDADKSVSASFVAQPSFVLSVTRSGSGAGTVTSDVAGITCGASCAASYVSGTVVTLTATPGRSSTFGGWSGACTGNGPCTVTMDANRSVDAMFGTSGAGAGLYTVPPCRLYDSRLAGDPRAFAAGETRTIVVTGAPCGLAPTAISAVVNLTIAQPTAAGYLSVYAFDQAPPATSNVNFTAGRTRANNAIIRLSADGTGRINIRNGSSGSVHVIVDVNGYFE